jgi:hypothetical protein
MIRLGFAEDVWAVPICKLLEISTASPLRVQANPIPKATKIIQYFQYRLFFARFTGINVACSMPIFQHLRMPLFFWLPPVMIPSQRHPEFSVKKRAGGRCAGPQTFQKITKP